MDIISLKDKKRISEVVDIHMRSFTGFFLTSLGRGFVKQLYIGFIDHPNSDLLVAREGDRLVGLLAYSDDMSAFYKYLLKKRFFLFVWYSALAFFRKPKVLFRLFRALTYSNEVKREEKYIELASLAVLPDEEGKGIASRLITALKGSTDPAKHCYIKLETDAQNNGRANHLYQKNGFVIDHPFETREGRKMYEYRFYLPDGKAPDEKKSAAAPAAEMPL